MTVSAIFPQQVIIALCWALYVIGYTDVGTQCYVCIRHGYYVAFLILWILIMLVCLYPLQCYDTYRGVWLVTSSSLIHILQCGSGACCNCKCWHCIVLDCSLHVMYTCSVGYSTLAYDGKPSILKSPVFL